MALGSIIYIDSNVYGHAASKTGDENQLRLAAEAQSLISFVKLGLLRLVHSDWVSREVRNYASPERRKAVIRSMPLPRHIYKVEIADWELVSSAFLLARELKLDEPDAVHAVLAARSGAEYLVSAEKGNFIDKLRELQRRDPEEYAANFGELRAVSLLQWHAEIVHG